jgi:hypothetical protein
MQDSELDWFKFIDRYRDVDDGPGLDKTATSTHLQLWRTTIESWFKPPNYTEADEYIAADMRYQAFDVTAHTHAADDKLEYAQSRLAAAEKSIEAFNERAYRLFQFSAVLAGVLVAGLKAGDHLAIRWWLGIPSLLCFALAIMQSLAANRSADGAYPMGIADAIEIEGEADEWKVHLAASLDVVTEGSHILADWKANRVDCAVRFLFAGILSLSFLLLS